MNDQNAMQLFGDSGEIAARSDAAAVARATQEIQAALVIAQRVGRDEVKAEMRIIQACKRKELAEVSEYEYSRGGTKITGPTIDLLRAIANRWGNLRYGWTEVDRRDGLSLVRAFAWDLLSNTQAERTFSVKHWRDTQSGGYKLEDERDIYEMLANQAARRVRACLEEVIDADIVSKAIDQCRTTMRSGETTPLKDRAVKMAVAFAELGVTQGMLETKLGNKLEAISENQLASLRRIYKALKDGVGTREDYFKPEMAKPDFTAAPKPNAEPLTTVAHSGASVDAAGASTQGGAVVVDDDSNPELAPVGLTTQIPPVRALRELCKAARIGEGRILEFLAELSATDGSVSSLEELQLQYPQLVTRVLNDWGDISSRINSVSKKGKN